MGEEKADTSCGKECRASMKQVEWRLYPMCHNKTRIKGREDTELKNFLLYFSLSVDTVSCLFWRLRGGRGLFQGGQEALQGGEEQGGAGPEDPGDVPGVGEEAPDQVDGHSQAPIEPAQGL